MRLWSDGSDSQALAALGAASVDDLAAVLGAHTLQEAMNLFPLTLLGLESFFHFQFLHLSPCKGAIDTLASRTAPKSIAAGRPIRVDSLTDFDYML